MLKLTAGDLIQFQGGRSTSWTCRCGIICCFRVDIRHVLDMPFWNFFCFRADLRHILDMPFWNFFCFKIDMRHVMDMPFWNFFLADG